MSATSNSFLEIASRAGTDKVTGHSYQDVYPQYLETLRDRELVFFEIGVAQGASINLWREYLPRAEVHGFDSNWKGKVVMSENVHIVDVLSGEFEGVVAGLPEPDVVVDDGGHWASEQARAFDVLWPRLAPGGLYFVEDLHAARLRKYKKKQGGADYIDTLVGRIRSLLSGLDESSVLEIHCHLEMCVLRKAWA